MTKTLPANPELLLVEDDSVAALATVRDLESRGYFIQHVLSGEQALDLIRADGFSGHLIIMDIDLGAGMDGTEAALAILEIQDVPILFLSSHTEPEMVERTEKISSYGYVVKNTGIVVLDASIKMALKLSAARKEQKRQSELLERSELFYRLTLANVTDAVFLTDDALNLTFVCPNAERVYGYSPDEIMGMMTLDGLMGPGLRRAVNSMQKNDVFDLELEINNPRKDKQHFSVDIRRVQIDGSSLLFTCHDMTEHQKYRARLMESEQLFRCAFYDAPAPLAIVQSSGKIAEANRSFASRLQSNPDLLIGEPIASFLHGLTWPDIAQGNLPVQFSVSISTTGGEAEIAEAFASRVPGNEKQVLLSLK